jgi:hypothetical protein
MPIQHRNITDAERHEPKGASIATIGQVLSSSGGGVTTFVNPNTLNNITLSSSLEASSLVNQAPAAVDTPLQLNFGTSVANSDVSVSALGVVTILTAGVFFLTVNLNLGRTTNVGISTVAVRLLVNDVATGFVQVNKIDTSVNIVPFHDTILRKFSINDTIKIQILRDSSGANDGGVISVDPVLAGWSNSVSAAVRIQKIMGAN